MKDDLAELHQAFIDTDLGHLLEEEAMYVDPDSKKKCSEIEKQQQEDKGNQEVDNSQLHKPSETPDVQVLLESLKQCSKETLISETLKCRKNLVTTLDEYMKASDDYHCHAAQRKAQYKAISDEMDHVRNEFGSVYLGMPAAATEDIVNNDKTDEEDVPASPAVDEEGPTSTTEDDNNK